MYLRLVFFIEVTSNFLSPERGYAGRERASSTSAPPFYILFKYIHEGGCILRSLLRCVAKGS